MAAPLVGYGAAISLLIDEISYDEPRSPALGLRTVAPVAALVGATLAAGALVTLGRLTVTGHRH